MKKILGGLKNLSTSFQDLDCFNPQVRCSLSQNDIQLDGVKAISQALKISSLKELSYVPTIPNASLLLEVPLNVCLHIFCLA